MQTVEKVNQKQVVVKNFNELYDFVKIVKEKENLELDTLEIVDILIYNWFCQKRVRALDSCYEIFNKLIKENDGLNIYLEDGELKAQL